MTNTCSITSFQSQQLTNSFSDAAQTIVSSLLWRLNIRLTCLSAEVETTTL